MSLIVVCLVLYLCPPVLPLAIGLWLAEDAWRRKRWESARRLQEVPPGKK